MELGGPPPFPKCHAIVSLQEGSSTPNIANQNLEDNERRLRHAEEEARKLANIVDQ
jgi:hypothetical protein